MKNSGFKNKPRKPLNRGTSQMKRSGFKPKTRDDLIFATYGASFKVNYAKLKKSPLRKVSKDPTAKRCAVLWKVFSLYIKERDNWTCILSGKRIKGPEMHAGHFIEDAVGGLALRYNEDNVHAQHQDSNMNSTSETGDLYEEALIKKIGRARVDELYRLKYQAITKDFDVEERIEYFREKLKALKK